MTIKVGRCLLSQQLRLRGMTQQELANRLDMPRSVISEYRNNRRIMSLPTARAIARELNCYIDDLYEWIEVKSGHRYE